MKVGLSRAKSPDKFDFVLMAYLIVMAITSFVSIYSSFGIVGAQAGMGYLTKQIMWFMAGFIALGVIMYLGNDSMFQFAKIAYWILMVCLIILFFARILYSLTGRVISIMQPTNGAISWFFLPGTSFQPSEFMKIVLIIITAGIIDEHNKEKVIDSFEMDVKLFIEVAKWALPPMVLILLQPDTGVVLIIGISLLAMLLCSGIRKEWIWLLAGLIIIFIAVFAYLYIFQFDLLTSMMGGSYKMRRITSWLDPESSINTDSYQQYMALLALGSAGVSGHGMQQFLVPIPEAQTDFIFAVIGQSWGLIGAVFILILCLGLDLHLCKIASISKNMFEKYLILGVLGMLLYQQVQNIGMIIGLLPITGITLPLISYGGSSMLSYLVAFGIIMNASAKAKKLSDYEYE